MVLYTKRSFVTFNFQKKIRLFLYVFFAKRLSNIDVDIHLYNKSWHGNKMFVLQEATMLTEAMLQ
jgi:hypothetical protein